MQGRVTAKVIRDKQADQLRRVERVLGRFGIREFGAGSVAAELVCRKEEQGGEADGDEESEEEGE